MLQGVSFIFIVPWILLFALAAGLGMWRGDRHGFSHGVKVAAITLVVGILILGVLFAIMIMIYYASGGH